jgi:hypothetical protein
MTTYLSRPNCGSLLEFEDKGIAGALNGAPALTSAEALRLSRLRGSGQVDGIHVGNLLHAFRAESLCVPAKTLVVGASGNSFSQ